MIDIILLPTGLKTTKRNLHILHVASSEQIRLFFGPLWFALLHIQEEHYCAWGMLHFWDILYTVFMMMFIHLGHMYIFLLSEYAIGMALEAPWHSRKGGGAFILNSWFSIYCSVHWQPPGCPNYSGLGLVRNVNAIHYVNTLISPWSVFVPCCEPPLISLLKEKAATLLCYRHAGPASDCLSSLKD